ncbi:MAG TPA: DUF6600 domain-containing protein [Verrucomicrobiae bacterium]|nr:DUF6600 domain-containing protein [Verrucomicrobiae bacterium]
MNYRTYLTWNLGVSLSMLSFTGLRLQTVAEPAGVTGEPAPISINQTVAEPREGAEAPDAAADSDAPATLVSAAKPLPTTIKPTGPVGEVIKLANSGVNESVLLAYVTNSVHTFNLGAEEIIYLNDIGVPGAVVTAMIQRDQELKGSFAAATAPPPQPEPEQMPAPPAEQMPPPEGPGGYPVEAPLTPAEGGSGDMFYDSLAPYGNWVDVEGYGRCWQPTAVAVNSGWQPYFDCGHWVYSDCGWYWLSDYSWGWAPFHYGSWFRHSRLGWCWVPGHVWGPSWVCWRYTDHHCGWAPLPPGAHYVAGVGLTFHGRGVWDRDDFGLRPSHYHFVDWNHFQDRELATHRLSRQEVARVYGESTVATRISGDSHHVINNGLPPSRVAAATHRPIHTVALRESAEPVTSGGRAERFEGGGQTLAIFRPRLEGRPHVANQPAALRPVSRFAPAPATPAIAAPWSSRSTRSANSLSPVADRNEPAQQSSPLILRGAQPSGLREAAPPSSLVIIGGRNRTTSAPSQPSAPSAPSAHPAPSASTAGEWARSMGRPGQDDEQVPQRRPAADQYQNQRPDWRGTVSSSPQPSWFRGNGAVPAAVGGARNDMTERNYQPVQRPPAAEVPRYSPSYTPQRSYSAPSWSAPSRPNSYSQPSAPAPSVSARPAAPAPSAPSAPSSSHSSSSSGRNGR